MYFKFFERYSSQGQFKAYCTARMTDRRDIWFMTSQIDATPFGDNPGTDVTFIMVSHPHGVEKQISFGSITSTYIHGHIPKENLQNLYLMARKAAELRVPETAFFIQIII